jgi:hypothetical protein
MFINIYCTWYVLQKLFFKHYLSYFISNEPAKNLFIIYKHYKCLETELLQPLINLNQYEYAINIEVIFSETIVLPIQIFQTF